MFSIRAKKVVTYVVPTILSSVCYFLFGVIDGIFVGQGVGTNALGAINLIGPYLMAVGAITTLINIGGVTIFAICIGKGDTEGANKVFRHGMLLLIGVCSILSFVGVFFSDAICMLFGASETFHQLGKEYLFWYSLFILPSNISYGLQNYCRNDGSPGLVSMVVFISTACNIFGDWLLIFPIPLGVKGAAIATGISQSLGMFIVLIHFIQKRGIIRFGKTKMDGHLVKEIIIHGLPEGVSQLATPVMTMCMNFVLIDKIGDLGVTAFSVIAYVASFTMAVFYGTSEGLQPLFGQSYGSRKEKDLKFYLKTGLIIVFVGSILVTGLIIAFSEPICVLFGAEGETLEYIVQVMPMYAVGFIVMAFNVLICSYLYSTERSTQSTIISFLRSIVINTAVILLLPELFGAEAVWITFAVYEAIVLVIAVVLTKHSERNGIVFK